MEILMQYLMLNLALNTLHIYLINYLPQVSAVVRGKGRRELYSSTCGESLFLRKLLWASLPNKRQKLRDR